eukprot:c32465_g1_i1.p1 GENE.c32465_g1_i1~~c32465_g1_i1.p1  ORF type:complete len:283 (+),score=67.48 c32465_g1_i1:38-886(+)
MNQIPRNLGQFGSRVVYAGLGLGALAVLGSNSVYTVEGGQRAVIFNRFGGVSDIVLTEGTHLRLPWLQVPVIFDVRARPRNFPSVSGSKDLQMVNITVRVLTRPTVSKLPTLLSTLGTNWDDRVLPSIVEETLKSVIAQFTASELLTMREQVSARIRSLLAERADEFGIMVDDVSITHLTFGREYMNAVERKQVALQEAERAKYIVDKARQDKEAVVVRGQGEAESARLITEACRDNPTYVELRRLEMAQEIAEALADSPNRVYLNANALLLPDLNKPVNRK